MRNEDLIEALNFRLATILDSEKKRKATFVEMEDRYRKELYFEISSFIHFIKENETLNILFEELLGYKENILKTDEYKKFLKEFYDTVSNVSKLMLENEYFKEFEASQDKNHHYSLNQNGELLKLKEILQRLENIEADENSGKQSYSYSGIITHFYDICTKWKLEQIKGIDNILIQLEKLKAILSNLNYYSEYQHDYLGVNSAVNLMKIYKAANPKLEPKDLEEILLKQSYEKGENLFFSEELISDCKKIKMYLELKLKTGFSLNITIERFKAYMELYFNSIVLNEKEFQKEFEQFLFNNGYYPISEAQVSNGRLDTLAVNKESAFLCEYKQIGFSSASETKSEAIKKILSSTIQSEIYQARLSSYPNLSSVVYVILFTKYFLGFKDNIYEMKVGGIKFVLKQIYLGDTPPSKVEKPEVIDIKELIKL